MVLSWQIVRFALKETFSISYGNYSHRDALIITLQKNEFSGYGECTAIDYYNINLDEYQKELSIVKSSIEKKEIVYPSFFYDFLLTLNLPSFLRSALDCAYWDLYGKLEKKSFLDLNHINISNLPESSITISVASVEKQKEKIESSSWNKFKVKLDHFDESEIKTFLSIDKDISLDANGSFTADECFILQNESYCEKFSYIEQPMKQGDFNVLDRNKYANWMADEDCQSDINLLSLHSHYRSINVKLVKCGGLTPALQMIREAKSLGFMVMIGCMTESTIGISAGAVLAPMCDYVDLDGANLIANDIALGTKILNGKIQLSDKPGLGIVIQ